MRKFMTNYFLLLLLLCTFISCSESSETKNDSGANNSGGDTGTEPVNPDPIPIGGGGGGYGGGGCTGTTSDGVGDGYAIHQFSLVLAGHQSWLPGTYGNSMAQETMPTIQESSLIFKSDSKLQVRLKVNSQPYPTTGETYCYGRNTNLASDPYPYTKLRFRVHLRDIKCDNPNSSNPNNCDSAFYLGNRYRTQYIEPVSVNSCSNIIDVGSMRNQTQWGTVVEVEDVKADSTCQANGSYCPAEKIVRTGSCWHMTMQISTDYTQSF